MGNPLAQATQGGLAAFNHRAIAGSSGVPRGLCLRPVLVSFYDPSALDITNCWNCIPMRLVLY